jgi:hypothetical protein
MSRDPNGIRIERIDGLWTVFVVEHGATTQRTFENEEWARNFAAGQRARLTRPPTHTAQDKGGV